MSKQISDPLLRIEQYFYDGHCPLPNRGGLHPGEGFMETLLGMSRQDYIRCKIAKQIGLTFTEYEERRKERWEDLRLTHEKALGQ